MNSRYIGIMYRDIVLLLVGSRDVRNNTTGSLRPPK
jgi:hypothetical protein